MPEHAIVIPRVSSLKQHEEDQRPALISYAERKGYVLDQVVPVSGRSAFHGRHVKDILAAVDQHVRNGHARVVIFRHVDRSSREGVFKGIDLLNKIMAAGARIEFSEQEFLNDNPGLIGLFMELAKQESEIKRDRTLQGNDKKRAAGHLVGRPPWGYDPVYDGKVRVNIKPNALGKRWIPVIFDAAINGKPLRAITEMLKGVPSPNKHTAWNDASVRWVIGNTTYYGAMKNNPNMTFEALIDVAVYKKANAAIENRRKTGRSTTKYEPALAKPYCAACWEKPREGAPSGKSPMYRTYRKEWAYYNCRGIGPNRKSCGAAGIPAAELESLIDQTMAADDRPHVVRVPVAGDDNDERRELLKEKIAAAMAANDYVLMQKLTEELMTIGPSEYTTHIERRETGHSVGQHWQTLSLAEKRDELTNWLILARMNDGVTEFSLTWRSPWAMNAINSNGES